MGKKKKKETLKCIPTVCLRCVLLSGWRSRKGGHKNSDLEDGICDLILLCGSHKVKYSLGDITQFFAVLHYRLANNLTTERCREMSTCKETTWFSSWLQGNENLLHSEIEFDYAGSLKMFGNSFVKIIAKSCPLKC